MQGISWLAVGNTVERVVSRRLHAERLTGLRIAIDEFNYPSRHHYSTLVADHDQRRAS